MVNAVTLSGDPLGRLNIPDIRDTKFPLMASVHDDEGQEAIDRGYRYWWQDGWWGDQWYTPQCVAYAWMHFVEDGPTTHAPFTPNREASVDAQGNAILDPADVYTRAQRIDEWPGENYDGTSVRAGAKILQQEGIISGYRWAWSLDQVVQALLTEGPLVAGTWWYEEMFYPDEEGLIRLDGPAVGGHAYLLNGVNVSREIIRIKQSYGRQHGKDGNLYIGFDDFETLLNQQGEVCIGTELATAA